MISWLVRGPQENPPSGRTLSCPGNHTIPCRGLEAGNTGPLTQAQFTQYLYGLPLDSTPGTGASASSNAGPYLLARVIEKATGEKYLDYCNEAILAPMGISDAVISQTDVAKRPSNEASCWDSATALPVLGPTSGTPVPLPDGGSFLYGVCDTTGTALSAASFAIFLWNTYSEWIGAIPGTWSWGSRLQNCLAWEVIFNHSTGDQNLLSTLATQIETVLNGQEAASRVAPGPGRTFSRPTEHGVEGKL